jgi:hypothetical protein
MATFEATKAKLNNANGFRVRWLNENNSWVGNYFIAAKSKKEAIEIAEERKLCEELGDTFYRQQ